MRVNIYHHEVPYMAQRSELVTTTADTGNEFFGLRFYTEPPLEHEPGDDDSSAITLWVPWTKKNGHVTEDLRTIALEILKMCDEVDARTQ